MLKSEEKKNTLVIRNKIIARYGSITIQKPGHLDKADNPASSQFLNMKHIIRCNIENNIQTNVIMRNAEHGTQKLLHKKLNTIKVRD